MRNALALIAAALVAAAIYVLVFSGADETEEITAADPAPIAEPEVETEVDTESAVTEEMGDLNDGLEITVSGQANGTITIDLFEDIAPLHAAQITALAASEAYDGVVFHRVIDGFMAQTGDVEFGKVGMDMRRAGTGGSELPDIPLEATTERSFTRGMVGMARSQNPNSANSQFFIMFQDGAFLDGQYTIIGEVVSGMDVVDAIKLGAGANGAVVGAPDVMTDVNVVELP